LLPKRFSQRGTATRSGPENGLEERLVQVEVVAEGCTKTLRLTEIPGGRRAEVSAGQSGPDACAAALTAGEAASLLRPARRLPTQAKAGGKEPGQASPELPNGSEAKPAKSSKFQLDIPALHVSFIARNGTRLRREFLLGFFEGIELLAVESGGTHDLQLRVGYV
jgi:hypothetical protein